MNNNEKNIRLVNINKQRSTTLNQISPNNLLSKLLSTFRKVMFDKSEFLANITVLDTKYVYSKSQNNKMFYYFHN